MIKLLAYLLLLAAISPAVTGVAYATEVNTAKASNGRDVEQYANSGKKYYEKREYSKALQQFITANGKAEDLDDDRLKCEILYNIGCCYFLIGAHGQALDAFYKALKICPPSNEDYRLNISYGIAGVYFKDGDYTEALKIIQPYYEKSLASGNDDDIVYLSMFIAMIANKTGDTDRALKAVKTGMSHLKECGGQEEAWVLTIESSVRQARKEYGRVKEIWHRMQQLKGANPADLGLVAIFMLRIATDEHRYAEAMQYAATADSLVILQDRPQYFEALANLYKTLGDYPKALACKDSVVTYKDSLEKIVNEEMITGARVQIEMLKFTEDMNRNIASIERRNYLYVGISIFSALLLLIVWMFFRGRLAKSRLKAEMTSLKLKRESQDRALAEEKLKISEIEAKMQEDKLRSTIESNQRQLSATAAFISSRNSLIQSLLKDIEQCVAKNKDADVLHLYNTLQWHFKNSSKEYDNLLVDFEKANPDFFRKLIARHPELTRADMNFLAYIRINLSMKDIAAMLNITPESCKRRKIRLSKKLGLETSADLFEYILSI